MATGLESIFALLQQQRDRQATAAPPEAPIPQVSDLLLRGQIPGSPQTPTAQTLGPESRLQMLNRQLGEQQEPEGLSTKQKVIGGISDALATFSAIKTRRPVPESSVSSLLAKRRLDAQNKRSDLRFKIGQETTKSERDEASSTRRREREEDRTDADKRLERRIELERAENDRTRGFAKTDKAELRSFRLQDTFAEAGGLEGGEMTDAELLSGIGKLRHEANVANRSRRFAEDELTREGVAKSGIAEVRNRFISGEGGHDTIEAMVGRNMDVDDIIDTFEREMDVLRPAPEDRIDAVSDFRARVMREFTKQNPPTVTGAQTGLKISGGLPSIPLGIAESGPRFLNTLKEFLGGPSIQPGVNAPTLTVPQFSPQSTQIQDDRGNFSRTPRR